MIRSPAKFALWCVLAAVLLMTGYLLINTTLMPYDDEGFVLISLRNYLSGLRLYDDVFSQYGPWPYVYHQVITTLGGNAPMTHALGRALTLFHWVATALLCGLITWRLVRRQLAAALASVFAFTLTWQMTSEPTHPGSLISLLVALGGTAIVLLPETRRPATAYAALGVLIGLLLLTKVNVGLLLAAGAGCMVLRYTPWPARWEKISWLGPAGLLAVPWVLLGSQLHQDWVLTFAAVFSLAAASLLWVTPPGATSVRLPARAWLAALPAAALTVIGLAAWVCLRGTSLRSLVEAVLISPLRMPSRFMIGIHWYWPALPVAGLSTLIAAVAGRDLRRKGELGAPAFRLVAGARAFALAAFLVQASRWPTYYGIFHFANYCLPLLPLFAIPLARPADEPRRLALWGVATVALLQVLHSFPVAGSQLGWATFLCVPPLLAGLWDLGAAVTLRWNDTGRRLAQGGALAVIAAAALALGLSLQTGWDRWRTSRPLGLPGAESIHLDGPTRESLRLLNLNASIHADLLFSRQGMYSHNLWSGVPTPTAQNATHWFWLLSEAQQREIIARLSATPRTAFITSISLDGFMVDFNVPVTGPLQDFVQQHYRELFRYRDYIFHVPQGSAAVPFGRYDILESASADPAVPPLLLRGNVLLDGTPAQIRFEMMDYPWTGGPELFTPATQVTVQPIDRNGRDLGPARRLTRPEPLHGLYRLTILAPRLPPKLAWQEYAVVVRDAAGTVLSESAH